MLCVKIRKGGKVLTIRGEWTIPKVTTGKGGPNSEKPKLDKEKGGRKRKDSVNQTVISVDPKGEKEFVVLTVRRTPLHWANNDLPFSLPDDEVVLVHSRGLGLAVELGVQYPACA